MENMANSISLSDLWGWIAAALAAIVLISNAAEKIVKAIKAAKAPNDAQNRRMDELEHRIEVAENKLNNDHARFEGVDTGNRVVQQALLALLDHGIDGNNIDQMQHAKEELQNYLINR